MIRLIFLLACVGLLLLASPSGGLARATTWDPDVRVVQDTSGAGQHETAIAVNPRNADNAVVVFKDYRAAERNYLDATTDGGLTWHEQPFAAVPGAPGNTDPAVFFRRDGRAYLVWTAEVDWPDAGLYCAWSDDGGFTWSAPVPITALHQHYDDKAWLAFDATGGPYDGTIYVAWSRFGPNETSGIDVAQSTDGGATWSPAVRVDAGAWTDNDDGAQWTVQPDGTLLLLFLHSNGAASATLLLSRSTDGGVTWGANAPIFDIVPLPYTLPNEHWRNFPYPSLAADPLRGWLTVIWADYGNAAANGADILQRRSTDLGATWSAPTRLNDDPPGLVRDQWFPVLAAAPDGRLTALWLDRRDDPANLRYRAYARTSLDGGLTWAPSVPVSSASSDPNQNIPPGSDGIGDYIGLAAGPGVVWGAWVDVRNGDQDIYAARERFPPAPTPTPTVVGPSPVPQTATPTVQGQSPVPQTATPTVQGQSPVPQTGTPTVQGQSPVPQTGTPKPTVPGQSPSPQTGTPTPSCTAQFSDVQPADYFYAPVRYLACHGVISGYADGTFRPYQQATRAQQVKMVVLGFAAPLTTPGAGAYTFADVPPPAPFFAVIETAVAAHIVSGYACGGLAEPCDPQARPYFRPYRDVTRGQLAKIVTAAAGWPLLAPATATFADVPPGSAFYAFVETGAAHGIVSGYACGGPGEPCDPRTRSYFRPGAPATRGQIAKIVYLAAGRDKGSGIRDKGSGIRDQGAASEFADLTQHATRNTQPTPAFESPNSKLKTQNSKFGPPVRQEGGGAPAVLPPPRVTTAPAPRVPLTNPIFGANTRANTDQNTYAHQEPSIAVNPVDPRNIIASAKDERSAPGPGTATKQIWEYTSTDAGLSWSNQHAPVPGPDAVRQSDPINLFRDDGVAYAAYLGYNDNGGYADTGIVVTRSTDGGSSWDQTVLAVNESGGYSTDKPWLAIDSNPASPFYHRMYLSWTEFGVCNACIHFVYSTDEGRTWSPRSFALSTGGGQQFAMPTVLGNGNVFVSWADGATIAYRLSTDGGATFAAVAGAGTMNANLYMPGQNWRINNIPVVAADRSSPGRLVIVWNDGRYNALNGVDISYVRSSDGGLTWTPPMRLNDDPTGSVKQQAEPWVTTSPNGTFHAIWYDARDNMDPNNLNFHIYYTQSTDGGATWSPDIRASDSTTNLNVGIPQGPGWNTAAGDYISVTALDGEVYGAWTDTRSGTHEDIYTFHGVLPPPAPSPTPPPGCGCPTATPAPEVTDTPRPAATGTPTPAATGTPTPAATGTPTPVATGTPTPVATGTPTPAATDTATPAATGTLPPQVTSTPTPAPSATATAGATPPPSPTGTRTPTRTPSPTGTRTPTRTPSATVTLVPTGTLSPTGTPTLTGTATGVPTGTPTLTGTATGVPTGTPTLTGTAIGVPTGTPTLTGTTTGVPTGTPTLTGTPTSMPTGTPSLTGTVTAAPTDTPTASATGTAAPAPTIISGARIPIQNPKSKIQNPPGPPCTCASPTPVPTLCPLGFSDVHGADYFYLPVRYLACQGVVSGYGDGTFRPYNQTTRAQMVKIIVLGFAVAGATPPAGAATFADVPPGFPFFAYIETAAAHSIVSGYTCGGPGEPCDPQRRPYFRPYANVTRGQLSKITVVAATWPVRDPTGPTFADVLPGTAFYEFVETAACHGVVSGYTCGGVGEPCDAAHRPYFRPYNPATRGQIAKIVYGALTGTGACVPPALGSRP